MANTEHSVARGRLAARARAHAGVVLANHITTFAMSELPMSLKTEANFSAVLTNVAMSSAHKKKAP